jgi:predicted nucleotidyltransferase component of viral defense system
MNLDTIKKIKEISLKAIYSDDHLMEIFVFKGGSAIDMFYPNMASRSSKDLDFSMEEDIEIDKIDRKIKRTLEKTFEEEGYVIFDYSLKPKPKVVSDDLKDFWGGYKVEFKIIDKESYDENQLNWNKLRKKAIVIGVNQEKKFSIDISKYEYCRNSINHNFDNLKVIVYAPEMIAIEKLRAICQQMPEYSEIVKRKREGSKSDRARDFFDFYHIMKDNRFNISSPINLDHIQKCFEIKRVPLSLISKIKDMEEYFKHGFQSVKDSVRPGIEVKEFEFYFKYLVKKCEKLEILWKK